MKKLNRKTAVILIVALVAVVFVVTAGDKLARLAAITQNIVQNLSHASHGDPRPLEQMTTAYIKANTGSTDVIDEKYLPRALKPFKKYTHPPFKMGACAVCHAPNRSKPAAILTHTVSQLCYKCHEPLGAAKDLDCNKCHNPHHADREELLRNEVTELHCPAGEFADEDGEEKEK